MNLHQEKIYRYLLDGISSGKLSENERIPTEKELGEMFGTSRLNAHYAVKNLENFGILRRNKKEGTFVKGMPSAFTLGELSSLTCSRLCVLNHCNPSLSHIHWNDRIFKTLEYNLSARGIEVIYKNAHDVSDVEQYKQVLAGLVKEGCNALLLVADDKVDSIVTQHPELLFEFHRNVFVFDRGFGQQWANCTYNVISINTFNEGVTAAEHLHECGYEKIIFCHRGYPKRPWASIRQNGLCSALRRLDSSALCEEITLPEEERIDCRKLLGILRKYHNSFRTAVVPANDELASFIIDAAAKDGMKVPEDFGLISFDDNSAYRTYNLTTLSPSLEKIGERLSSMIINTINGENSGETLFVRIDSELIKRNTTNTKGS